MLRPSRCRSGTALLVLATAALAMIALAPRGVLRAAAASDLETISSPADRAFVTSEDQTVHLPGVRVVVLREEQDVDVPPVDGTRPERCDVPTADAARTTSTADIPAASTPPRSPCRDRAPPLSI